jgi:membrane protein YdbS with pleckstrin-like domain
VTSLNLGPALPDSTPSPTPQHTWPTDRRVLVAARVAWLVLTALSMILAVTVQVVSYHAHHAVVLHA